MITLKLSCSTNLKLHFKIVLVLGVCFLVIKKCLVLNQLWSHCNTSSQELRSMHACKQPCSSYTEWNNICADQDIYVFSDGGHWQIDLKSNHRLLIIIVEYNWCSALRIYFLEAWISSVENPYSQLSLCSKHSPDVFKPRCKLQQLFSKQLHAIKTFFQQVMFQTMVWRYLRILQIIGWFHASLNSVQSTGSVLTLIMRTFKCTAPTLKSDFFWLIILTSSERGGNLSRCWISFNKAWACFHLLSFS